MEFIDDKNKKEIIEELDSSEIGYFIKLKILLYWFSEIYDNKNYIKSRLNSINNSIEYNRDEGEIKILQARLKSYEMTLCEMDDMINFDF